MPRPSTLLPTLVLLLAFVLIFVPGAAWAQSNPVISVGSGLVLGGEERLYIDNPLDVWVDRDTDVLVSATVQWPLTSSFFGGAYLEYETISSDGVSGYRVGFGPTFMGRYLQGSVGLEGGGMVGLGYATADGFDSQTGLEFGMLVGPVFQVSPSLLLGVHLQSLYGFYSGGDAPEGVQNISPRVAARLYFTL
jgi:hypothetical protein